MSGRLSEHPLAELLQEVYSRALSGSLRVEHDNSKIVLYLEEGRVIYAASNVPQLRLAEYLKAQKLLTEEQLSEFSSKRSDLALAGALTDQGVLSSQALDPIVANLAYDTVRLALIWTEGAWHYDSRTKLGDSIRLNLDLQKLLLEWSRKVSEMFATKRFPNPEEIIAPGSDSNGFDLLTPVEGFLLSRVERPIKLRDLVALSGQSENEALRTIYGLTLAGVLQREQASTVLGFTRASAAKPKPAPPPAPAPPAPVVPVRTEEDDVKDFLQRMDAAVSYYDVLDVRTETSDRDIKQAYYNVARKYHPDRFRGRAEADVHARLESAFARITQAYETLMDPSRRRAHDSKLAAQEKARKFASAAPTAAPTATEKPSEKPAADTPAQSLEARAEDSFKQGFAALQQGQMNVALSMLAAAARAVPNESRYRAYYGQALARSEKTRRSAEAELQAAIRLDSRNANYHVMLAELYRDLGFAKRALSEAQKALSLEPGNSTARDLAHTLK
jgi:curved DNA-binding protein CbpA